MFTSVSLRFKFLDFDLYFWTSIYIFGLRLIFLDFDLYFWTSIYIFGLRFIFLDFDLYFLTSIYIFGLRFIFFGNMIRFSFYILKLELRFVQFDFISNDLIFAVYNFNEVHVILTGTERHTSVLTHSVFHLVLVEDIGANFRCLLSREVHENRRQAHV